MHPAPLTPALLRERPDILVALHAAARRERSAFLAGLATRWFGREAAPPPEALRTAPCC